jgi:hypothetical protein
MFVGMAYLAVLVVELILDLECLPIILAALALESIHVATFPCSEVFGNV